MKDCITNDPLRLIEYYERMMHTHYNHISAWYAVWLKNKNTISTDSVLRVVNQLWKSFNRACMELVFLNPSYEKTITSYFSRCELRYQSMHNEYINRGKSNEILRYTTK